MKMISLRCPTVAGGRVQANRAVQEAETFSKLKHEYVVELVEVVETCGNVWIVSQRGLASLADCIGRIESWGKVFELFLDVVVGVCHLRSKGYIHCNLVPGVVEIDERGATMGGL
jgi:serine/threonine protein kinase